MKQFSSALRRRLALSGIFLILCSSCEWDDRMLLPIQKALQSFRGKPLASESPSPTPAVPSASPSVDPEVAARHSKEHAELLSEIYTVIFLREPKDRSTFGSYVDTLNQGATLEGVYNGFVHSSDFRVVETAKTEFLPAGKIYFAEELARMVRDLGKEQVYTIFHTQPLAKLNPLEEQIERIYWNQPTLRLQPAPHASAADLARVRDFFRKASFFTLKRVLGDEAQRVFAAKSKQRSDLAAWYAQFAVDRCALGVPFGIAQRNDCNPDFHRAWAMEAPEDRILWEVLNRLHRLMNHFIAAPSAAEKPAPSASPTSEEKKS